MPIAYFDCFHGAAGDMLLASLLDAGLDLSLLKAVLALLPLEGATLEHQRIISHHLSGSRVSVSIQEPQPPRTWRDIRALLEASPLPERTHRQTLAVFARLARAEASVHGVPVDAVHFHEIGALDSIIDITGVCAALELLNISLVFASPLPLGSGWVSTQHGLLPVPAPATLAVLAEAGVPTIPAPTGSSGELLTPTAAALLAELAQFQQPPMHIHHVGYGFGQREYEYPNGLRVWIGEPLAAPHPTDTPPAVDELRCNLDDATGELVAYTIEQLLTAGALDAWATPLVMKKGRPAVQLSCLALPADTKRLAALILRETPTLGVRWSPARRSITERQVITVETPWGAVRLKQKLLGGKVVSNAPEYDDCAALAQRHAVPLTQVYAAAVRACPPPEQSASLQ